MKTCSLLVVVFLFFLLFSCTQRSKKSALSEGDAMDQSEYYSEQQTVDENFRIPSPMELFVFMEKSETPFIKEALSNPNRHSEFVSQKSKALNLGVYSADLAYCSVYGNIQETIVYFNTAKILATELGLHEGYGAEMAMRIDDNLNNIDSLNDITTESFNEANLFLDEQGLSDIQGLMIAGGWIEGLYLALKSVSADDLNNPVIERIADQQVLLDNLLKYLNRYSENSNVLEVISQLDELQEVYDQLYYNDENTRITKEQYVAIANKVAVLRDSMIIN
ncbi:MAG: hypothetical protein WCX31_07340 [Salinivirgaceae bacterium]